MKDIIVMKFGGTSVGDAGRMLEVAQIVKKHRGTYELVVVVSAMSQVTDLLISAANNASARNRASLRRELAKLEKLHRNTAQQLTSESGASLQLRETLDDRLRELRLALEDILESGVLSLKARDNIMSFGERLSIQLVAMALAAVGVAAQPVEATQLIVTDDQFGDASPLLDASSNQTKQIIQPVLAKNVVPVVSGFIGATSDGAITTLGRGGSDYSATILGNLLDAHEVWIYTDVDGAMTADPRIIPHARTLAELSYEEAAEMSYFGAEVLHPLTMVPASLKNIPIRIKNTFKPEVSGTRISLRGAHHESRVKAISSISHVSLITVQGNGMGGVPGMAAKIFGAVAAERINVILISQASSEHNISLVVNHEDGIRAAWALRNVCRQDLDRRTMEAVNILENLAIIAVVGEGMKGQPGVAGNVFSAIGDSNINVVAIAQGSSERNISFVVDQANMSAAVRCVHDAFHITPELEVIR